MGTAETAALSHDPGISSRIGRAQLIGTSCLSVAILAAAGIVVGLGGWRPRAVIDASEEASEMFDWITKRRRVAVVGEGPLAGALKSPVRPVAGKYSLLYEYLEHRYANTVVLTFAQIEDLVGFALPDQARLRREWWTDAAAPEAGAGYADAWRLASRTALPNLFAQIVTFDRAS